MAAWIPVTRFRPLGVDGVIRTDKQLTSPDAPGRKKLAPRGAGDTAIEKRKNWTCIPTLLGC